MDHAFINIPEVDNFRPRLVGRFFKWVSRFFAFETIFDDPSETHRKGI